MDWIVKIVFLVLLQTPFMDTAGKEYFWIINIDEYSKF